MNYQPFKILKQAQTAILSSTFPIRGRTALMEQASPDRLKGNIRHPSFLTLQSGEEGEKAVRNTITESSMRVEGEHSKM